jgi:hypothetical protein
MGRHGLENLMCKLRYKALTCMCCTSYKCNLHVLHLVQANMHACVVQANVHVLYKLTYMCCTS